MSDCIDKSIYEEPEVIKAIEKADSLARKHDAVYSVWLGMPWRRGNTPTLFVELSDDPVVGTIEIFNNEDGKIYD